jgi:RNA polymerase sigma-70 factor (ECF subfamily)
VPDAPDFDKTVALVAAAQKGDRGALDSLFARYAPRVERIVALRLGWKLSQFASAEDVAQAVLLKAFQGLERFEDRTEGAFLNWLSRLVECEIVDQSRKNASQKRGGGNVRRFGDLGSGVLASSIFAGSGPTPSKVAQAKEADEAIEAALLELPKHHREAIVLRHLCGMEYAEVAETLGLGKEETARKACSRAIQALKQRMDAS